MTDLSYAVASAFYCGKLVLASSTYDGGLFPPMKEFLEHLQTKGFRNRRVGLIENGSWAPAAARLMRTKLEEMKDIHLYETVVSLRGALNQTSERRWTLWWLNSARNKLQQTVAILVQMMVLLICFMSQGQSTVISV